jgi:hypothetical protein
MFLRTFGSRRPPTQGIHAPHRQVSSTRSFHIGSSSFSVGNKPMGWVDSSKGWKPQKVVSPWRAIASIVSSSLYPKDSESSECQPSCRGWGSRVILTLQRGTRCFSNSCTRTGEASCNQLPKVPPTRYGGNPLVQARPCGTVHSFRPRIREKSSVYG